ncbi:MAG TPA: flagellar FliJ family protein [Gemmatimonadales bacterium]|jgi:flagellar export protein FliJ|nr:flagellar FliJ family protein [Gemmatimonadales bacterium]
MKRFTFRLQGLLHLREAMERMHGRALGHAEQHAHGRRNESAESDSQLADVQAQAGDDGAVRPAGMWHAFSLSVEAARTRAEADAKALADADAAHAAELQRFSEARIARRALERLRDIKVSEWGVDVVRAERNEMDEVARRRSAQQQDSQ